VFLIKCNMLNMNGSFIIPIMLYLVRARGPQIAHIRFNVIDELIFQRTVYQIAMSFSVINGDIHFVLMTA
jgi:hypothetical protein